MKKNIISLLMFLALLQADITLASQRLALVIGNGDYSVTDGKLINPPEDARAIAEQLEQLGFEVMLKTDLKNQEAMETAVDNFAEQLPGKEIGLFYYAGHALQLHDNNYLLPTEAKIKKAGQVKHRALSTGYLLDQMAEYNPQLSIVILDACRDNPFPKDSRSGATRGLGRMQAPSDMLIAFATKPGATAEDGNELHSPYTEMLLRYLKQAAHIPIETLFNQVGVAVEAKTQNNQIPQSPRIVMSPLHYSFCFADCANREVSPIVIQTNSPDAYFNKQNSLIIAGSSLALLSVFLVYGLYYRKQYLQGDMASAKVAVNAQAKVKPHSASSHKLAKAIQPDLSAYPSQAFAYLCDANTHKAVGVIESDKPASLGRSSKSSIKLDHEFISAHHAEISWHPGAETFLLQDKGSTNGTWIEQQPPLSKQAKTVIKRDVVFYLGHQKEAYYIYKNPLN